MRTANQKILLEFTGGDSWEYSSETSSCDEVNVAGGKTANVRRKSFWGRNKDVICLSIRMILSSHTQYFKVEAAFHPKSFKGPTCFWAAFSRDSDSPRPLFAFPLFYFNSSVAFPTSSECMSHCWSSPSWRSCPDKAGTQQGKAMIMKKNKSKQVCHLPADVLPDSALYEGFLTGVTP